MDSQQGGRHAAPDAPRPGEGLVRAGAAVFVIGVLAVVATLVPYLLDARPPRLAVLAGALLLPLGLGIALLGLLRGARAR